MRLHAHRAWYQEGPSKGRLWSRDRRDRTCARMERIGGSAVDLHQYLTGLGSDFISSTAWEIADLGTIISSAVDANFLSRAVLWTPVPVVERCSAHPSRSRATTAPPRRPVIRVDQAERVQQIVLERHGGLLRETGVVTTPSHRGSAFFQVRRKGTCTRR